MDLKGNLATGFGIVGTVGALIVGLVVGAGGNEVISDPSAGSPAGDTVALEICEKDDLVVTKTLVPIGNYFVATWEEPGLRYDLTWQEGGTAIAVERAEGTKFEPHAEQITPEFLACINEHQITEKDGTH